jgi:hypothetical protein
MLVFINPVTAVGKGPISSAPLVIKQAVPVDIKYVQLYTGC